MGATMEYFDDNIPGNTAKLSAIILLSAFGPSCDQIDDHYDKDNDLSRTQRGVLEDVFTHTDWELMSDMVPETFFEGKKMFFNLAQAICSCASYCETWKEEMVTDV